MWSRGAPGAPLVPTLDSSPPVTAALPTLRGCIYRALPMSHLAGCPLFVHQIYRSPTLGGGGSLIYDVHPPPPPPPPPPAPADTPSCLLQPCRLGCIRLPLRLRVKIRSCCFSLRCTGGGQASSHAGSPDPRRRADGRRDV